MLRRAQIVQSPPDVRVSKGDCLIVVGSEYLTCAKDGKPPEHKTIEVGAKFKVGTAMSGFVFDILSSDFLVSESLLGESELEHQNFWAISLSS